MKLSTLIFLLFSCIAFSQVGINNTNPQATLDVTGDPTITTATDGIIAPRLTLQQLTAKTTYTSSQTGALVYITNVSGTRNTATAHVNAVGYYYFNGTDWQSLAPKPVSPTFIASLGVGAGSSLAATIQASSFQVVPLSTVTTNIGGGTWNATNYTYTVAVAGTYLIKSSIRLVDGAAARNIFQAVNTANIDIPDGVWQTNNGQRWTFLYTRIAKFNVGDALRLYIYSDGNTAPLSDASLNITLLN